MSLVMLPVNGRPLVVCVWGIRSYMRISECGWWGVSAPNSHVVQGLTIYGTECLLGSSPTEGTLRPEVKHK